ncbi:MAG: DUF485 domain-containing protein [Actinomycetota bacterium]|nr:DUF485 domain-containing protein [Actinomycetota bacterium]
MPEEARPGPKPGPGSHQDAGHAVYEDLHASADFQELRQKYRRFALPATVAFLVWYLLYVLMANWAPDFMSIRLVGNINVALVFGLLQFVSTFAIAYLYARYMNTHVDPLANGLEKRYNEEVGR